jgi:hypothetical protein
LVLVEPLGRVGLPEEMEEIRLLSVVLHLRFSLRELCLLVAVAVVQTQEYLQLLAVPEAANMVMAQQQEQMETHPLLLHHKETMVVVVVVRPILVAVGAVAHQQLEQMEQLPQVATAALELHHLFQAHL